MMLARNHRRDEAVDKENDLWEALGNLYNAYYIQEPNEKAIAEDLRLLMEAYDRWLD